MSGDNLHGKQPIKFYSENLTLTKILLIKHHFNFKLNSESSNEPEDIFNDLDNLLAS